MSFRSVLMLGLLLALGGCRDDETSREAPVDEKVAAATQPFVGEVIPASATDLDSLIAERGSLTFLSWNGQWIGMHRDTDITLLPGGQAHMFQYSDDMFGYRGTYAIDAEGTIKLTLPTFGHAWPTMSLLKDDRSLLLVPKEEGEGIVVGNRGGFVVPSGSGGYWPFRPIPAEQEAQARQDIATRGGR